MTVDDNYLCFPRRFALELGSPFVFREQKKRFFAVLPENEITATLKRFKMETRNLKLGWRTHAIIFVQFWGAIGPLIRASKQRKMEVIIHVLA